MQGLEPTVGNSEARWVPDDPRKNAAWILEFAKAVCGGEPVDALCGARLPCDGPWCAADFAAAAAAFDACLTQPQDSQAIAICDALRRRGAPFEFLIGALPLNRRNPCDRSLHALSSSLHTYDYCHTLERRYAATEPATGVAAVCGDGDWRHDDAVSRQQLYGAFLKFRAVTVFQLAAERGCRQVVRWLVESGLPNVVSAGRSYAMPVVAAAFSHPDFAAELHQLLQPTAGEYHEAAMLYMRWVTEVNGCDTYASVRKITETVNAAVQTCGPPPPETFWTRAHSLGARGPALIYNEEHLEVRNAAAGSQNLARLLPLMTDGAAEMCFIGRVMCGDIAGARLAEGYLDPRVRVCEAPCLLKELASAIERVPRYGKPSNYYSRECWLVPEDADLSAEAVVAKLIATADWLAADLADPAACRRARQTLMLERRARGTDSAPYKIGLMLEAGRAMPNPWHDMPSPDPDVVRLLVQHRQWGTLQRYVRQPHAANDAAIMLLAACARWEALRDYLFDEACFGWWPEGCPPCPRPRVDVILQLVELELWVLLNGYVNWDEFRDCRGCRRRDHGDHSTRSDARVNCGLCTRFYAELEAMALRGSAEAIVDRVHSCTMQLEYRDDKRQHHKILHEHIAYFSGVAFMQWAGPASRQLGARRFALPAQLRGAVRRGDMAEADRLWARLGLSPTVGDGEIEMLLERDDIALVQWMLDMTPKSLQLRHVLRHVDDAAKLGATRVLVWVLNEYASGLSAAEQTALHQKIMVRAAAHGLAAIVRAVAERRTLSPKDFQTAAVEATKAGHNELAALLCGDYCELAVPAGQAPSDGCTLA